MMFFDSYAILEIINQNEAFLKFKDEEIITNTLNFSEVYYSLLRIYNKKTADYWASNLNCIFIDITKEIVMEAAEFKYNHKKQKLSYADCIGYVTALKNNLLFVTGDKEFSKFKEVLFMFKM